MMKRDIIVNSNCYHKYSVERAIEGIHRLGYKNIELTCTKGWTEHVFPSHSFSELLRVKKLLSSLSIDVPAMSGHCNLMDNERLGDFIENINLADFFGARTIVSSIGEAHLKDRTVSDDDVLIRNLEQLIPELEKKDMELVLETHGDHGTATRIKSITDAIASDRIGICYDSANAIFYGDVKGCEDLENAVDSVKYIHIKDKRGERTDWDFPALGDGYVDFKSLLSVLDAHDNNSPLSIEIEFTSAGSKDAEEVDVALERSALYLNSLGYTL